LGDLGCAGRYPKVDGLNGGDEAEDICENSGGYIGGDTVKSSSSVKSFKKLGTKGAVVGDRVEVNPVEVDLIAVCSELCMMMMNVYLVLEAIEWLMEVRMAVK
jgi:hypothetical protein